MNKLAAVASIVFFFIMAFSSPAYAFFKRTQPREIELLSSVMWQQSPEDEEHYFYPPGIPAVLKRSDRNRQFRIEQYFESPNPINNELVIPRVSGTWPRIANNDLQYDVVRGSRSNRFIEITQPTCEQERTNFGYRCIFDFDIKADIPTGTLGISIGIRSGLVEFTHPNSVFWIIIPEQTQRKLVSRLTAQSGFRNAVHLSALFGEALNQNQDDYSDSAANIRSLEGANHLLDVKRMVVRITLGYEGASHRKSSGFIMGSGYLARDIKKLRKLFKQTDFTQNDESEIYVVTAAHLFPVAYSYSMLGSPNGLKESEISPFRSGSFYDIHVNGHSMIQAATLVARNVENDIALLKVRHGFMQTLALALGLPSAGDIRGLKVADPIGPQDKITSFTILGYPAKAQGRMVERKGQLVPDQYPTDDTSNFGPIAKIKLEAVDQVIGDCSGSSGSESCALAEPGMSGGPIINDQGEVVGLTVERPNDTNTLIALDLTSVESLTTELASEDERCMLRFNPFDRILVLINRKPDCDYGNFGSPRPFKLLAGEWIIQEILGFADEEDLFLSKEHENHEIQVMGHEDADLGVKRKFKTTLSHPVSYQFTNGHSIINGHAIINGHTIINGHSIIRSHTLIVNRQNLESINQHQLVGGFKLNPDSFRSFVPKGVRILSHTSQFEQAPQVESSFGRLIVGTRETPEDHGFSPVYSIREFIIWLHSNIANPQYQQLICTDGPNLCFDR